MPRQAMRSCHDCRFYHAETSFCRDPGVERPFKASPELGCLDGEPAPAPKSTAELAAEANATTLPADSGARKGIPLARGCLDYFPAALAEVARLSQAGNDKHNPGEELHHSRGKSSDHADCIVRHLAERGIVDTDGFLHDVKVAWRALANLQEVLEARGAPLARGARVDGAKP